VAIKQVNEDQTFSIEENKLKFEQEIAIIWGVSSHPNIITLVGYSENPRCIITKVLLLFHFLFIFIFWVYFCNKIKINKNSYMMKIYTNISKIQQKIFQVKLFWNWPKILHLEWIWFIQLELLIEISNRFLSFFLSFPFLFFFFLFFLFSFFLSYF